MNRDVENIESSKQKNKIALVVYYGMRVLVATSIPLFIIFDRDFVSAVSAAFIFLLMLTPSLLKQRYKFHFPFDLDLAIVAFIFVSLFLGSLRDFYEQFPLLDVILHFQGGLLLGVVGFVVVYLLNSEEKSRLTMTPGFVSIFAICFSLAISVIWEIYEYTVDSWFGYTMQETGLPDTMGDLIFNGMGAIIVAIIGFFWMRRRQRIPFTPKRLRRYVLDKTL